MFRLDPEQRSVRGRARGSSLLELMFVIAVAALTAEAGTSAMAMLSRSLGVEAARLGVLGSLVEARRIAYASQQTVEVAVIAGADEVLVTRAGETLASYRLPRGTAIERTNAAGRVRFFSSGYAENATIVVGSAETTDEHSIVVNQRGAIR